MRTNKQLRSELQELNNTAASGSSRAFPPLEWAMDILVAQTVHLLPTWTSLPPPQTLSIGDANNTSNHPEVPTQHYSRLRLVFRDLPTSLQYDSATRRVSPSEWEIVPPPTRPPPTPWEEITSSVTDLLQTFLAGGPDGYAKATGVTPDPTVATKPLITIGLLELDCSALAAAATRPSATGDDEDAFVERPGSPEFLVGALRAVVEDLITTWSFRGSAQIHRCRLIFRGKIDEDGEEDGEWDMRKLARQKRENREEWRYLIGLDRD
jgi:hypothetical protein